MSTPARRSTTGVVAAVVFGLVNRRTGRAIYPAKTLVPRRLWVRRAYAVTIETDDGRSVVVRAEGAVLALAGCQGHRVAVAYTPSRPGPLCLAQRPAVRCLDEAEHVLAALAGP